MDAGFGPGPRPYIMESCWRCRSHQVITNVSAGDLVCRDCGEIQAERMVDDGQEWRDMAEDDGNDSSRARASAFADEWGANASSTYFDGGPSKEAVQMMKKCQILSSSKVDRRMVQVAECISDMGSKLRLTRGIMVTPPPIKIFPFVICMGPVPCASSRVDLTLTLFQIAFAPLISDVVG